HARAGRVRWRTGLWFAAASMVGAYAGGRLAAYIPDVWLLIGFAGMMLATAVAMLRGRRSATRAESSRRPVGWVLVEGAVVGWAAGRLPTGRLTAGRVRGQDAGHAGGDAAGRPLGGPGGEQSAPGGVGAGGGRGGRVGDRAGRRRWRVPGGAGAGTAGRVDHA